MQKNTIEMVHQWNSWILFVCLCLKAEAWDVDKDVSKLPTVFESKSLPVDNNGNFIARQMASVGNGHVATTVYTDTVYMNGLYNGYRGESHRARIPSGNNIRINITTGSLSIINHTYALDVSQGVFFERIFLADGSSVEQRTFAHRFYTRLIITQVKVTTSPNVSISLSLSNSPGPPSADLDTSESGEFGGGVLGSAYMCAHTKIREDPNYQNDLLKVCTISTAVPDSLTFTSNSESTHTFITAYGFSLPEIETDFMTVAGLIVSDSHKRIFDTHVKAWKEIWSSGEVKVEGNVGLAKVVYASFYYILSSLPVTTVTNTPNEQFYGLSPGGLAYGSLMKDYQGHSFWDSETWMFPPILYLFPDAAKEILNYRMAVAPAARDHAKSTGFRGVRFPWESARTGREVSPDCCPEPRDLEIHITSDISFAIRQYIAMTRDLKWLRVRQRDSATTGCGLLHEIAEFWTSRSSYNASTGYYDIKGVMPPDEDATGVDNNGFTNVGAGFSIFYAKYAECLCNIGRAKGTMETVPDEWIEVAKALKLLYDVEKDYHPEYEGYAIGTPIKQADVVLMGFPLLYKMSESTRRNNLLIYENVTRENGPAMTWAMHTIGFLELDEEDHAASVFNKSYQWYLREPFKIWTEKKAPILGATNFITGIGGFLQSIFSGYGGIRIYPEKMIILKPRVPPDSTGLIFHGLKYLGNVIDVNITQTKITVTPRELSAKHPLQISSNDDPPTDLFRSVSFSTQLPVFRLEISTKTPTKCPLPLDKIGTPKTTNKYSKYQH